jgi:sugar/nucleoside kinase (ribokinase family)
VSPSRRRGALDFVSFGSAFLEVVFGHTDQLPRPGEEIFVDEFAFSCGGVVTSAVAASRAGASAAIATVLGDDLGSRLAERLCAAEGVQTDLCLRAKAPAAGITVVINYEGDRAFITHMPPAPQLERPEPERWCDLLEAVRPAWAYLHAGPNALQVLHKARAVGTRVAVDVNYEEIERFGEVVVECAKLGDLFLPNEEELRRVTGEADVQGALAVASSWCPLVVCKRGARGATVAEAGRAVDVAEGVKQVEVKDLTGAGDAFAGALVGALARGASLSQAVVLANAAGSETAARLGATGELDVPEIWSGSLAMAADGRKPRGRTK